ncbi:NAD(P)H-dependent oxidoreductase [Jejudonia soesokkakensis]|uniref:NAD(P)H-dependent oxidoreductase n=1 Tax=Jejudonia soesokkakensis TaxID=1323432 RepID=A0ABW2MTR2_9FLAO
MSSTIIEKLAWRYATKKFDSTKKLSEEKLTILKEAFRLTATSYGLQPLKMVVINNTALQKKLVPFTHEQQQVADASHVLVLCTENEITSNYIKRYFEKVEKTRNTPRAILHPFELYLIDSFSEKTNDEIHTWMAKQAYIALGNLLTVCAHEQIDSCPIEGFDPEKYDDFLALGTRGLRSVLVLAVGYRAQDDLHATLKKVRRSESEIIVEID